MLAILSKKKDAIRVESVNTDATYETPPDFVGINVTKKDVAKDYESGSK